MDYSIVMGLLNFTKVSTAGGDSNVRLRWELIDELTKGNAHLICRVSSVVSRLIQSFKELVRVAPQKEQHLLDCSPACAKLGYTKYLSSWFWSKRLFLATH